MHCGATSQDVLDTAMVLCLRPCLERSRPRLDAAVRAPRRARARASRDADAGPHAACSPRCRSRAGLKIARWALGARARPRAARRSAAAALARAARRPRRRARGARREGEPAVRHGVADAPGPRRRAAPWHAHRNAWIDLLGRIGAGASSPRGQDRARHRADAAARGRRDARGRRRATGVGASSAMPHKRNPVALRCTRSPPRRACPACSPTLHRRRALGEHERALGGWQAELAVVPEIAWRPRVVPHRLLPGATRLRWGTKSGPILVAVAARRPMISDPRSPGSTTPTDGRRLPSGALGGVLLDGRRRPAHLDDTAVKVDRSQPPRLDVGQSSPASSVIFPPPGTSRAEHAHGANGRLPSPPDPCSNLSNIDRLPS